MARLAACAALAVSTLLATSASAERLRIATFNVELNRDGPGLLLRDILKGEDPQVTAAVAVIAAVDPDVILLTGFDWDHSHAALAAFQALLAGAGADYPFRMALRPNSGLASGLDLDGDGETGTPRDAQGYGRFAGEGGMAVLSRLPVDTAGVRDFSAFLWRDLPGTLVEGAGLSDEALAVQRLSTTGHWDVPLVLSGGRQLSLLAYLATPPVFDGAEDRNGRRNHDETAFWSRLLDGALPFPAPEGSFVILGDANLDPEDGDGRREAIRALLDDPRLSRTDPQSPGGVAANQTQGGINSRHSGNPAHDTADWPEDRGLSNMRVDYVLPSAGVSVTASGVWWPATGTPDADTATAASRHRLVWVDIDVP